MRTHMIEATVFDLDGTLVQSRIDYEEMRRRAIGVLSSAGVEVEGLIQTRRIWEIILGGERLLTEMGIESERVIELIRRINEELNAVELGALGTVEPTLHAREVLTELRKKGLSIGVATRSCNEYAIRSLERTGLRHFIDVVLARDDVQHPKPDPRHLLQVVQAMGKTPNSVIYIGDTTTDLKTAMDAGIAFIGFLRDDDWGKRLRESGCKTLIDDLLMLPKIIDGRR